MPLNTDDTTNTVFDPGTLQYMLASGATAQPSFPLSDPNLMANPAAGVPEPSSMDVPTGLGAQPPTPALTGETQQAIDRMKWEAQPPQQSKKPAIWEFMQQMFKGPGYQDMGPGQPARPVSRMEAFENFLGNFLQSFSQGMAGGGTGPGANARGFGIAMNAPYANQMGQYQTAQQNRMQQAQMDYQQAQTENLRERTSQMGSMVSVPDGQGGYMMMPFALAQKVYPAQLGRMGKVEAAEAAQKRYIPTAGGRIFDTETKTFLGEGKDQKITVTPELAEQMPEGVRNEVTGKQLKPSEISSLMRGYQGQFYFGQGAQGAFRAEKGGPTGNLGYGSPQMNPMNIRRQDLIEQKYGDTFDALTPSAQRVLYESVPVHDQIQDLKKTFESMRENNTMGTFFKDRALYMAGIQTDIGNAADTIAKLELNRVTGAARVLKGGSRAMEALELAMKHLPNVWVDSPKMIYGKLDNLDQALQEIEDAANKYGKKSGMTERPARGAAAKTAAPAATGNEIVIDLTKKKPG